MEQSASIPLWPIPPGYRISPLLLLKRAISLAPRHTTLVRITHWITALCFVALLLSGALIVISHPRFYWGQVGNVHTPALFELPIPASRSAVQTGYGYVLPDQNGWSRSLHFQAAWVVVWPDCSMRSRAC